MIRKLLENSDGYKSNTDPVQVSFELTNKHPGNLIGLGGAGFKLGFGKCLALHLVFDLALDAVEQETEVTKMNVSKATIQIVQQALMSAGKIHCVYEAAATPQDKRGR